MNTKTDNDLRWQKRIKTVDDCFITLKESFHIEKIFLPFRQHPENNRIKTENYEVQKRTVRKHRRQAERNAEQIN
jgi:hypothetical protein